MDEPRLAAGTVIGGRYRVVRTLRAGGMGLVVEAEHVRLGRRVAIKLLHPDVSKLDEIRDRFEREGCITSQLQSEHVVEVLDIGEIESGEMFIVMELLVGRDLDQVLDERTSVPVEEAIDYVVQAAEGISAAHAAGLVHRDIKPANLFLAERKGRSPVIKLLDFGVTKEAVSNYTITTSFFGTPQYMSPEQIESPKHVDARTDQYSLAIVLYELISGVVPFDDDSAADVAASVLVKPVPPLQGFGLELQPGLNEIILRALEKEPADRFADLADFTRALVPYGPAGCEERVAAIHALLGREMPKPEEPPAPVVEAGSLSIQEGPPSSTVDEPPGAVVEAKTLARASRNRQSRVRRSDDDHTTEKIDKARQLRARAQLEAQRRLSKRVVVDAPEPPAPRSTRRAAKTERMVAYDPPSRPSGVAPSAAGATQKIAPLVPIWVYFAVAVMAALVTAAAVRWV